MKRSCFAVVVLAFTSFASDAFALPPGCHCSPCTCGPCHCGGGYRSRGGVGVNVDLGGLINSLNRRKTEYQPVPTATVPPVAHSEVKTKTKKTARNTTTSDPFRDVKLTGATAKELASANTAQKP